MATARTPIGTVGGALASFTGPQLGAVAIKGALARAGVAPTKVGEVIMGNVVSAGVGQAPARQAAIFAGISENATCTTVNKVCASGMKAIMYASQSILLGSRDVVVAGAPAAVFAPALRAAVCTRSTPHPRPTARVCVCVCVQVALRA